MKWKTVRPWKVTGKSMEKLPLKTAFCAKGKFIFQPTSDLSGASYVKLWGCTIAKPEYFVPQVWGDQPAIWGDHILEKTQPLCSKTPAFGHHFQGRTLWPPKSWFLDETPRVRKGTSKSGSLTWILLRVPCFFFRFPNHFGSTSGLAVGPAKKPHLLDLHSSTKVLSMGLGISQRRRKIRRVWLCFSPGILVLGLHWCTPVWWCPYRNHTCLRSWVVKKLQVNWERKTDSRRQEKENSSAWQFCGVMYIGYKSGQSCKSSGCQQVSPFAFMPTTLKIQY